MNWQYWGGIREENQQVFYYSKNAGSEKLIYDFTVNTGDTITFLYDPMVVDTIFYSDIM